MVSLKDLNDIEFENDDQNKIFHIILKLSQNPDNILEREAEKLIETWTLRFTGSTI